MPDPDDLIFPPDDERAGLSIGALGVVARMLIERRDVSRRGALEARERQRREGWDLYTVADNLEGTAAAYSVACSIVAGASGVATIDELLNDPPTMYVGDLEPDDRDGVIVVASDGVGDTHPERNE